ncbi:hypothetical protein HG66A1_08470 [Gimesia chilikensis]|uniref:Uncharacterized protein n=1 Tax=Gimesia chilikensis TaxID=2605989 RepID=A0A517PI72_9PLAN|nr:hypothetical protein HG66A1_08470 [Gimesia chilikensis]
MNACLNLFLSSEFELTRNLLPVHLILLFIPSEKSKQ